MELKIENLKSGYGEKTIIKNIYFTASAGKVTGIAGPNGVGKSTLLKCIAGLHKIQDGKILIDEEDLLSMDRKKVSKIRSYVPQKSQFSFPMTTEEFVTLGRRPYVNWSLTKKDYEIIEETLSYLNINHLRDKYVDEISGGEYQKVMLARALVQEPKILLLDEPTSALDIRHQIEVMQILRKISREKNCIVLLVMHDLSLISRFTDQAVFMQDGKVTASGNTSAIITEELIENVFHIKVKLLQTQFGKIIIPLEEKMECITE
ncbi:MAG: ABC transporter ATP-binding protein [Eubacteriales bacterium]|nr:ABC transporter ATP-binding protein [Eubacteriales bacterium]